MSENVAPNDLVSLEQFEKAYNHSNSKDFAEDFHDFAMQQVATKRSFKADEQTLNEWTAYITESNNNAAATEKTVEKAPAFYESMKRCMELLAEMAGELQEATVSETKLLQITNEALRELAEKQKTLGSISGDDHYIGTDVTAAANAEMLKTLENQEESQIRDLSSLLSEFMQSLNQMDDARIRSARGQA